ncbi:MAG: PorV/PorQ family protein [Balneolaceae bacterium]|nr:PorV/PorQ family protein [Balneolaceae bacterium]MBO6547477.1 PorV/PorQ family protein [Balneolaceae bacterium]MBO6647576.1 PorV/PorQ family protein [Balneolaceae bacterium]
MKKTIFFLFTLISPGLLCAQQSGLKLLEIGATASELARSETSVATPNGAPSLYSNPALLAMSTNSSISLGYTNWISDSNNLFGGINLRKNNRALAFSIYTSGVSGLEQRDAPGESNGDFSIQYVSLSGAYAYDFSYFSAGISGHYLNEEIFPYRANGYALSLGLASSFFNNRVRLGTSLLNLGEMEKLNQVPTELPASFNIGIAADVMELVHFKSPDLPILVTLMADYVIPVDNSESNSYTDYNPDENYMNLGVSLIIADVVQVNSGYKTGDNTRPVSFGAGFITEKVTFNYALIPFNTGFGTVHSIGIQYQL